ncbi:MAG: hypothetical protein ACK4SF_17965 [Algoriphagus aquaeductus]|uniref:hypothetical protein n=1 Tax=Algoriphagus aquaeductus TaxID=475299 RepID=UPI00391C39A9
MKNQLWLFSAALLIFYSCSQKEESLSEKPLSEQQFEFEIYDSLVVDYLGNLYLADISEDGKTFLLIDQQTDTLFVTDSQGAIIHKFSKKGEGPGMYPEGRLGPPRFLNDEEIIIPSWKGFYLYSLSGDATRSFSPEFNPTTSFVNQYDNSLVSYQEKIYYPLEGRIANELGVEGREFQTKVRRVEVLDLSSGKFTPGIPFPKTSKFSTGEKSFLNVNYNTTLTSKDDSLYVAFRNEPVIYGYHFSQLDTPTTRYTIPFEEFFEKEPKDAEKFGPYEARDLYVGAINSFYRTEKNRFLIKFNRGLTDEEYQEIFALIEKDQEAGFEKMRQINTNGSILFDGKSLSSLIKKPKSLGFTYEFISEDEIWFTPDFENVENDYSVIYKTRIISN